MSGGGSSALWGRGYVTDANGPNNLQLHADDVRACTDIEQKSTEARGGGTAGEVQRYVMLSSLTESPSGFSL